LEELRRGLGGRSVSGIGAKRVCRQNKKKKNIMRREADAGSPGPEIMKSGRKRGDRGRGEKAEALKTL